MMAEETHWAGELPAMAKIRAEEYADYGVPKGQAKTVALYDLGYSIKDIAEILGVSERAVSDYHFKFNLTLEHETLRLALAAFGGPKMVLSYNMIYDAAYDDIGEYWYVIKPIRSQDDIADSKASPPDGEVILVKVSKDAITFDANSTIYGSLEAMAVEIYQTAEFDFPLNAHFVYELLVRAGLPMHELAEPRRKGP